MMSGFRMSGNVAETWLGYSGPGNGGVNSLPVTGAVVAA